MRVLYAPELQKRASPGIVIALVGNKSDLAADRAVPREEAAALAAENNMGGGLYTLNPVVAHSFVVCVELCIQTVTATTYSL